MLVREVKSDTGRGAAFTTGKNTIVCVIACLLWTGYTMGRSLQPPHKTSLKTAVCLKNNSSKEDKEWKYTPEIDIYGEVFNCICGSYNMMVGILNVKKIKAEGNAD